MAVQYSIQKMVSDGTLSTIALGIQYLQHNDIYIRIAGEETPPSGAPSGYTWSFLDNTTLKILPVVPNGVEVVVYRRTDVDAMYNIYSQNAQFDEATIDENNQQLLYIAQEYLEQGLPGAGVDTIEYVRDDGSFTYYRMRRTDGSYSEEFTVPSASNSTKVLTRESLRRSYAEAGYNLVDGSFEAGGTLVNANDVLLQERTGKAFSGPAGTVDADTDPASGGFVDRSGELLRLELTGGGSLGSQMKVINVDIPPYSGNLSAALDAAQDGDVLVLGIRDYNICGKYRLDTIPPASGGIFRGNGKKYLTIIGSGMPTLAADKSRWVSGSGTVIQGALINFADGFRCYSLGVDVGPYVVDNLNGGQWMEGFIPGTHQLNTHWADFVGGGYIKDVHFGDIKVLMKDPLVGNVATFKHSMLIEYINGGSHGYLESIGGFYGVVIKSRNITPKGPIVSHTHDSASVYFKSDQYTQCYNYRGGNICIGDELTSLPSPPVLFTSQDGVEVGNVTFELSAINVTSAIKESGSAGGGRLKDIFITSVDTRRTTQDAVIVPPIADNWLIGSHNIIDGDSKGIVVFNGATKTHIGDGKVDQMASDGYNLSGECTHGTLRVSNCGGYGVNNDGLAYVNPDRVISTNCTLGAFRTMRAFGYTLLNSWVSLATPEEFSIWDDGSALRFSGRVGGTPSDDTVMVLPAGKRPKKTQRFMCIGYNGTAQIPVIAEVRSDGTVMVERAAISGASPRGVDLSPVIFNY